MTEDIKTATDSNSAVKRLVMPVDGSVSQVIDLLDYTLPVICNTCSLPTACATPDHLAPGGCYPSREKVIWYMAEKGERCCECDEPILVNRENPYIGWMKVEEVREIIEIEKERIRKAVIAATA